MLRCSMYSLAGRVAGLGMEIKADSSRILWGRGMVYVGYGRRLAFIWQVETYNEGSSSKAMSREMLRPCALWEIVDRHGLVTVGI